MRPRTKNKRSNSMAIIKNESQAFGYKYSSLADIEKAGFEIPIMRTKVTEFGEYVEWLDKDGNWQQGAKVIEMEMKGMNAAQAYGSALTYARRYTVQLAKAIACDDDKAVEKKAPDGGRAKEQKPKTANLDFEFVKTTLANLKTVNEINRFAKDISDKYPNLSAKQKSALGSMFNDARIALEFDDAEFLDADERTEK